jgi:predicted MFS family arabinose efflux permease
LLLAVELLDELSAGVPVLGAPAIQKSFGASYELTASVLLAIPALVAMVVEPVIFLLADRHPRRRFILGGLLAMAAGAFSAALAGGPWSLAAASSLAGVAAGVAVHLAQGTLCDTHPGERERMMTRWALMGVLGDLCAPALYAALAWANLGWRTAHAACGALIAVHLALLWRAPMPAGAGDADDEDEPLWRSFAEALANRTLLVWLLGCFLCELLDEIFVVFATLRLRDELGAGVMLRSGALGIFTLGGVLGLGLSERLLRRMAPLRLLALWAAACTLAYLGWLAVADVRLAVLALFFVGVTATPLYPLVVAQTYAAHPGRSGAVNAAGHLFTPLSLALPWLLGLLADRGGPWWALAVLIAQPLGLFVLALWQRGRQLQA